MPGFLLVGIKGFPYRLPPRGTVHGSLKADEIRKTTPI